MLIASLAYFFMLSGMSFRKTHPRVHIWLMGIAMAIDIILVLTLELQRDAIHTALSFSLNWLQQSHIVASSIASTLYIPILILGFKKFSENKNRLSINKWHKYLGIAAFVFRTLGYALMFSMLKPH
jgi:hypothetical protein